MSSEPEPDEHALPDAKCLECAMPMKALTRPGTNVVVGFACSVCPFKYLEHFDEQLPKPGCTCAKCGMAAEEQKSREV